MTNKRSFPEAADGTPAYPMEPELWAAGCDLDTARFVARQLAKEGYTLARADISKAAIAAAIEMAAKRNELTVRSIKEALDYREWEAAREIAMKGPPAIRALATPAQTDALEAVRLEAERAGYERGVREAARKVSIVMLGRNKVFADRLNKLILGLIKPVAQEDAP